MQNDLVNGPYLSRTAAAEHLRSLGLKIAPSTLAKMAVMVVARRFRNLCLGCCISPGTSKTGLCEDQPEAEQHFGKR